MPHSDYLLQTFLRIAAGLSFAAMLLVTSSPLQGGIVASFGGASGPGLASMSFNNINFSVANNDDVVGASPNVILVNQKAYKPNAVGALNYIDMVFDVNASGGVTEYMLSEGVDNSTGVDWTDYHLQLGFDTGADFVPSGPGDGLDFDAADFNSPYMFAPFTGIPVVTEDDITVFGGVFPNISFAVFAFPIDVPDGITSFTVRQYPTIDAVPEPGSILLVILGFTGLALAARRGSRAGSRQC